MTTVNSNNALFLRAPDGADWRAMFFLPGRLLHGRGGDEVQRLWLLLADGRVLVCRVRGVVPGVVLAEHLAGQFKDDVLGNVQEPDMAAVGGWCGVLYGAPASPLYCVAPFGPAFAPALAFNACLDLEVLTLLAGMAGEFTFWANARNYGRLTALPKSRERRQALARFPLLVAPILLHRQRYPNYDDVKRFRWRAHDDAVVAAIDQGRDLIGALAHHYGISRGLVRSSFCAQPWAGHCGKALPEFLQFLDVIPAHQRPASGAEVDASADGWAAFWSLFDAQWRAAAVVFKAGFCQTWAQLTARFAQPNRPLNLVLIDAQDFLRAVVAWLRQVHHRPLAPDAVAIAWTKSRGFASLLAASERWHEFAGRQRRWRYGDLARDVLPIVDAWQREDGCSAFALSSWEAVLVEGDEMHHCVADYWPDCVLDMNRLFSLHYAPDGPDQPQERATALYEATEKDNDLVFRLAQLRGCWNAERSERLQGFAEEVTAVLNRPEFAARRVLALAIARRGGGAEMAPVRGEVVIDPQSVTVLRALFDLRADPVGEPAPPAAIWSAPVAGYLYSYDAERESLFAPGDPLRLVREPGNTADPLALRLDWRGEKIGYVPRPENAIYAVLIDAGERFSASIERFSDSAPWHERLWFRIERQK